MRRGAAGVVLLLATLWPAMGGAQEAPPETTAPLDTTVVPATVAPTTTVVAEEPSTTTPPTTLLPTPEPGEAPATATTEGGPRTLTVTPHTDLVDAQVVVVRGRGWVPRSSAQGVAQCISGAQNTVGCGPVEFVTNDAAGNFRLELEVDVILETGQGTFDCRVDVCVIGSNDNPSATGARFVELHFDPAGPDPIRRTASIDPDSALVDQQDVTVTSDGFGVHPPYGGFAQLAQCRLPAAGFGDCDPVTHQYEDVPMTGRLEAIVRLEALLHLEDGTEHDCRTGGCVLLVRDSDEGFAQGAQVPLDYDPLAPLAPPPNVVVDPATDVLDGHVLDVTGSGWRPGSFVVSLICPTTAAHYRQCDSGSYEFTDVGDDGELRFQTEVHAVFRSSHGPVDCRQVDCAVFVGRGEGDDVTRAVQGAFAMDPAGPLLSPEFATGDLDGLQGGHVVEVRGDHGRVDGAVELLQCLAGAEDRSGCMLGTRSFAWPGDEDERARAEAAAGAAWRADVTLRQFLHLPDGRLVDCHLTPCALVAVDAQASFEQSDRIATGFLASVEAVPGPVTATPTFTG